MGYRILTGLLLAIVVACSQGDEEIMPASQAVRAKRDTSTWVRQSSDAPLMQDFRNGTTNNGTANVWKKCMCDSTGCDCHADYQDFNATKLYFRIEHIQSHLRFRVNFRDENKTFSQNFVLVNGTSCFQFRRNYFDQVCFFRYGAENNTLLEKACLALGVRIQGSSSISADFECVKYMDDGTTHVGPLNMTQPDLYFLANYTLYGAASANGVSSLALFASLFIALLISRMN